MLCSAYSGICRVQEYAEYECKEPKRKADYQVRAVCLLQRKPKTSQVYWQRRDTFARSKRPERVGKSPAELMTGKQHPHWLELLGFERFRRSPVPA